MPAARFLASRLAEDRPDSALAPHADVLHPPPGAHALQMYEREAFLDDVLARYVGAGLGAGDAAVVIATPARRAALAEVLHRRSFDVPALCAQGRLVLLDARATLDLLLLGGTLDDERFVATLSPVLGAARRAVQPGGSVRAFGEMVLLLRAAGRDDVALALEQAWERLARDLGFSILCACPLDAFHRNEDEAMFLEVARAHSGVFPSESYAMRGGIAERLRSIAHLQQRAGALETELERRHEIEAHLQERNDTLRALVAAAPLPIVVIDLDTTVRLWNPAAERLFGWSATEVTGAPLPIVPPERCHECAVLREAVGRGESFHDVETVRLRRDGTAVDVAISAAPLADADGNVQRLVLLFEDRTERNLAERDRQRLFDTERAAREQAERATRARDEFLAMLGHELRNPLSAVRSAIAVARLDGERRERALEIATRQSETLRRLVDDLLDAARITRGKITLKKRPVPFAALVARAVEATRPLVAERGHALLLAPPPADALVEVDEIRFEQVLTNVISNAARYTDPGGRIELIASVDGADAVCRVRDDGIGIPPESQATIFDLFEQAGRGLDRVQGGLGIGLTLARTLIELHGGSIALHSDGIGKGAEFTLRLPLLAQAAAADRPAERAAADAPAGTRVLLVEDNPDTADSMVLLLEMLGHRVDLAPDGTSALALVTARVPEVMLVDIGLPDIDGYEVARRVRADASLSPVLLVALTGYGQREDRERAFAAGFDHHFVKPVDPDELNAFLIRCRGARDAAAPVVAGAAWPESRGTSATR
jgi:PAS domain S-box-containing protein